MTSLSLVSGFVASLLALRTNQGISRLLEGRQAFGKVVLYTRDMASIISNFVYDKDPQLGLMLARHLGVFSWLLKNFLRGQEVTGSDEDIIRTMLPKDEDAEYVVCTGERIGESWAKKLVANGALIAATAQEARELAPKVAAMSREGLEGTGSFAPFGI